MIVRIDALAIRIHSREDFDSKYDGITESVVAVPADTVRLDAPTVRAVESFRPPAVEHGEVDGAVDGGLHSRRSAGFQRVLRIVEPDVDPRYQLARECEIVILDEQYLADELGPHREFVYLLDQSLAGLVVRVSLARYDQ
jgi:hypothetical protein